MTLRRVVGWGGGVGVLLGAVTGAGGAAFGEARVSHLGAAVCLVGLDLLCWWNALDAWAEWRRLPPRSPAKPYAAFRALVLMDVVLFVTLVFGAGAAYGRHVGTGAPPPAEVMRPWLEAAVAVGTLNATVYLWALARTWRHLWRVRTRVTGALLALIAAAGIVYAARVLAGPEATDVEELRLAGALLQLSWAIGAFAGPHPFGELASRAGA